MNLFVVPAYNEEANVPRLLEDLERRPGLWSGGRLILVDDGSQDATAAIAEDHPGALPVEVLRLERNQGPGRAFDRGFRRALELAPEDGFVITLEADNTSDLDALPTMLEAARSGADIVLGSTHAEGGGLSERRGRAGAFSRARRPTPSGAPAASTPAPSRPSSASTAPRSSRAGYERFGDGLVRESGFACKAEILFKLSSLGARVEEVPVVIDWAQARGREQDAAWRPTLAAYVRVMTRQLRTPRAGRTRL